MQQDLSDLLEEHDLQVYSDALTQEGVTSTDLFAKLSPAHIEKLGVKTIGDQLRFQGALNASASEDSEFAVPSAKKRERNSEAGNVSARAVSLKRARETTGGFLMPDTDPRSTSLYQAIASYVATRTQEGPKRHSGQKAITAQIVKAGGEVGFVNKVKRLFPHIKDTTMGQNLHGLPLDELCGLIVKTYPQPWLTHIPVRSREGTPTPSPRKSND